MFTSQQFDRSFSGDNPSLAAGVASVIGDVITAPIQIFILAIKKNVETIERDKANKRAQKKADSPEDSGR